MALLSGCTGGTTHGAVQTPGPSIQFMGQWGTKGADPGQLDQPSSIATDLRGNVYIADPGSQFIDKFQPGGEPLLSFQDPRLKHPQSIAVDRGGAIYVSDPVRASVFVFLPDGSHYREIRVQTRPNEENTLAVAVADDGSVNVLDVNAAKLFDFSPAFRLQRFWIPGSSGPGRPHAIVSGPADAIFAGGIAGNALLRFDDGKLTSQIQLAANPAVAPPSDRPGDQFAMSSNYIFQADANGHIVHVWSMDGTPKADLDLSPQLGDDQRSAPPIAVTPVGDLLVLDAHEARVLRYHLNL
jgi:streptogramin lyase